MFPMHPVNRISMYNDPEGHRDDADSNTLQGFASNQILLRHQKKSNGQSSRW